MLNKSKTKVRCSRSPLPLRFTHSQTHRIAEYKKVVYECVCVCVYILARKHKCRKTCELDSCRRNYNMHDACAKVPCQYQKLCMMKMECKGHTLFPQAASHASHLPLTRF